MHPLTAQQLAAVLTVSDHDVNPRSGSIALTWNATGVPSLYLLTAAGGEPQPLIKGPGQYGSWAPDGHRLVFLQGEGGGEIEDVVLLETLTGRTRHLTRDAHSYMWPRFAPDGRLALLANRDGNFDPYLLDTASGECHRLVAGERAARNLAWSPDGRWLGFARQDVADAQGNIQFALHVLDIQTGKLLPLGSFGGDFFEVEWAWRPGGSAPQLCVAADNGEFQDLLLLALDGTRQWLTSGEGDKSQPQWSPDGRYLAYLLRFAGNEGLWLLDTEDGSHRELSVGAGVHHQPRWSPDGKSLSVLFEGATQPSDLWRVSLTGTAQRLTSSLPATLSPDALTASQPVSYPTFDQHRIHGLLYSPRAANGAAVVWVHGGPTACHRNTWFPDIQLLTNLGYTVLAPNVRGSTGHGKSFRDLARLDWGGGDLADLAATHAYLQAGGFHRIGIMGGSYGGYLTLMALCRQPELWDAGAALYPIANLHTLYQSSRPSDLRPYLEDQLGTPDSHPALYFDRSPVNFVGQVTAPLLLLQGANDIRTPLAEAASIAERLAATGKLHDLHVYPNEGHGFQHRANREDALGRVLAFFNQHLNQQ